jgi:hypothetical protein
LCRTPHRSLLLLQLGWLHPLLLLRKYSKLLRSWRSLVCLKSSRVAGRELDKPCIRDTCSATDKCLNVRGATPEALQRRECAPTRTIIIAFTTTTTTNYNQQQ